MATSSPPPKHLSLAIIGGGIAGLTLTIALLNHCPSLSVTLYESRSAFGEIGAGVGFQPNIVRTMTLIDPRITTAFHKCRKGEVENDPPDWFTVRVGDARKPVQSTRLSDPVFVMPARKGPGGAVHRAHFLDELVKLIPKGIAHFHKKLVDIKEAKDTSGDAVLYFADGSTAQHTAVLGCDGIKSRTRDLVLGPDLRAVFTGKYAYRGLLSIEKAIEILGEEEAVNRQMYVGYGGHVLTFPIANGTLLNVVAFSSRSTWPDEKWIINASRDQMLKDYQHWCPTVRSIMENLQSPDTWAIFNHPPTPVYYRTAPLTCLVGDAAHASSPHQGSGAGMCIEDAYVLANLLAECVKRGDLEKAFAAYDEVRRPRSQKLVQTSREAGMLWDFEDSVAGDDLVAFESNAMERMSWIWDHEISGDLEGARQVMRGES
ncbi:hypothetical protein GQ44DRAFT_370628 [Phaeosphaeriaceae sp. PMI808]|nr:hypothetical protein GQ44DRAFT_370628 [Phaeosphaeriaceae sp. PMI808]